MTADVLREAAALMRDRAEAAPVSPWLSVVHEDGRAWVDVPDEDGHAWGMHGFPAASRHVASWHPLVALAVADLLELVADDLECDNGLGLWDSTVYTTADRLARAYLGGVR